MNQARLQQFIDDIFKDDIETALQSDSISSNPLGGIMLMETINDTSDSIKRIFDESWGISKSEYFSAIDATARLMSKKYLGI